MFAPELGEPQAGGSQYFNGEGWGIVGGGEKKGKIGQKSSTVPRNNCSVTCKSDQLFSWLLLFIYTLAQLLHNVTPPGSLTAPYTWKVKCAVSNPRFPKDPPQRTGLL